ncbi:hypothetical protein Tco_1096590 [Tanacetum coccineum]
MKIEESLNVKFDETPPPSKTSPLVDDDLDEEEAIKGISHLEDIGLTITRELGSIWKKKGKDVIRNQPPKTLEDLCHRA